MKFITSILTILLIVSSAVMTAYGKTSLSKKSASPAQKSKVTEIRDIIISENIFLKDYQSTEQVVWLKVDPPLIPSQSMDFEAGVKHIAKDLIDGIYVQFDKKGNPKGLVIGEIKFVEKGLKPLKGQRKSSLLSSQLAMVGQYYNEAANSFRAGDFIRSPSPPSKGSGGIAVPGYHKGNVAIWFDIQKRRWALHSPKGIGGSEIARYINGLSLYLRKAAARSVPYLYEIYILTISGENLIAVEDVDTHHIRPPGHSSHNLPQEKSLRNQALVRKDLVGEFLKNVFKMDKNARFRAKVVGVSTITKAGLHKREKTVQPEEYISGYSRNARPPLGRLFRAQRMSHRNMVFSWSRRNDWRGVEKIEISRTKSGSIPASSGSHDYPLDISLKARFTHPAFYAATLPNSLGILHSLSYNSGYMPGSLRFSDMRSTGYGLQDNERLMKPKGPVMDLRAGMIIGMGVGIEVTALGTSILPAGGAAYASSLSGLVGGTSVLTGGVILAAVAVGASIQYLFHLQDLKNERKRIEYLLERVHQRLAQDHNH